MSPDSPQRAGPGVRRRDPRPPVNPWSKVSLLRYDRSMVTMTRAAHPTGSLPARVRHGHTGRWVRAMQAVVRGATLALALASCLVGAEAQAQSTAERPTLVIELGSHSAPVRRIDAHAARGVAVTASDDRTARVWELASGELRHVLRPLAAGNEVGRLYGAAIHPTEPLVAVAGTSGSAETAHLIYLFNLDSGALVRTIDAQAGDIRKLAWSADGSVLLAGYNGTHGVRAFALDGRALLDDRLGGPVFGIAVGPGGQAAAVALDGTLRSYRVGAGAAAVLGGTRIEGRRPAAVAFSPDGARLVVGYATPNEGPELFDAATLRSAGRLPVEAMHGGDWRVLSWSADGRSVYVGGTAYTPALRFPVLQIDVASARVVARIDAAADSITDLQALPGGELVYTSFDGSWGVIGPGSAGPQVLRRVGAAVATVRGDAPLDLEVSADARALRWGTRSAGGGFGFAFDKRHLQLAPSQALRAPETRFGLFNAPSDWNLAGRAPVIGGRAMTLAADERGRALAIVKGAGAAPAAAVGTNRALYRLTEQGAVTWRVAVDTEIRALNASADGRLLVAAMADGTVRWWRAGDGALLLTLLAQADGRWVIWTPSGYYDASVGADRVVGWALPHGQQQAMSYYSLNRFRDRYNRPDVIDAMFVHLDEGAALTALASRDEQNRLALERDARARAEAARAAERAAAEQARQAALREAELRAAAEQAEREAAARAQAARAEEARRAEAERLAQAEAARLAERQAAERAAQLEASRLAALREQEARAAAEQAARERVASAEQARLAEERRQAMLAQAAQAAQAEREAAARESLRLAALARAALERDEAARAAAAAAEQARLALEREQAQRLAQAREQAAREQAQREAAEREAQRVRAEARAAAEREAAQRAAALEAQRLAARLELARLEAEHAAAQREAQALAAAREAELQRAAAEARRTQAALDALKFPPAVQAVSATRIKATTAVVSLPFALVSNSTAGDVQVQLRLNGRPAEPADMTLPKSIDGKSQGFARVQVGTGRSQIEIIAINRYGISEPLAFIIDRDAPPPPPGVVRPPQAVGTDLYVLAIGVADYERAEYKLGLSAKDARDFAAMMQRQEGRLYRRVIVRTLTDKQATRTAILRELDALSTSVTDKDTAMVFVAGHGINDASGTYYYLPYDGKHEALMTTAVPQGAIVAGLSKIRGKTIFFVDTCFAGSALGSLTTASRQTERLMNDLASSENGVVVFASSTGHEESEESDEWGNGAFTKALLDGLGGKADFMRAGRVTYAGLNLFVSEEVTRLTSGRQRPVFISPRGIPDFAVARL